MKIILFISLACVMASLCQAQKNHISGTVVSISGFPISGAKVKSKVDKRTVYTDSSGSFQIPFHSPDVLFFSFDGFSTKEISISRTVDTSLSVSLLPEGQPTDNTTNRDQLNSQMIQNGVNTQNGVNNSIVYSRVTSGAAYTGASFPVFTHKEDTEGSPYLLDKWTKGKIYGTDYNQIQNDGFIYNYNKMDGSLVMTKDMQSAVTIDRNKIGQFSLFSGEGDSMNFVLLPVVSDKLYTQVLVNNGKYRLYKLVKTTFKKANYQTTGMTSSGHNYDEYADSYSYYIGNGSNESVKEITLKQKSVKEALPDESVKIETWFKQNGANKLSEPELIRLVNYLNQ